MRSLVTTCLSFAILTTIILSYSTLYCLICVSKTTTCPDPIAYDVDTIKYVISTTFENARCGVAVIIISVIEILNKYL